MQDNLIIKAARKLKNNLTAKNPEGRPALFDHAGYYAVVSLLLTFIVEWFSRMSLIGTFRFLILDPYAYFFNSLIIFLTLTVIFFIPKRGLALTLISVLWALLGLVDYVVQKKRSDPFVSSDLRYITDIFRIFPKYLSVFEIVMICVIAAAVISLIVILAIRSRSYKPGWKKGTVSVFVTAVLIVIFFMFGKATTALSTDLSDLKTACGEYGYTYCFAVNMFERDSKKPDNYSKDTINKILERIGKGNDNEVENRPNVIFVQLESFFDLNGLKNYEFSENPTSFFEELKKEGISGSLKVPSLGAGTVNTEFEVLSGMSLGCFGAGEYPYKTLLARSTCETVAYDLLELGYSTHAIHNYAGTYYDRNKVYPNMGFQTFTSMEYMNDLEYNQGGTPIDMVLTGEIIETMKCTDSPDLILAVGVEGQGKYPPYSLKGEYNGRITPVLKEGAPDDGIDIEALTYYADLMKSTDDFIKELVYQVRKFDEDCMLVFYSSHLPSLSLDENDITGGDLFSTEYVIVSNFGLEKRVTDKNEDLCSYQLAAKALGYLGINNGTMTKLHQTCMNDRDYEDMLYQLEYDIFSGEKYLYGGKNKYYASVNMTMGVREIRISSHSIGDGVLNIYGEFFTPYSKLVVNGELCKDTVFVSPHNIQVKIDTPVKSVCVVQYSDGEVILSKTETLTVG